METSSKRILKFHNEDYKEHKPIHCIIRNNDKVDSKNLTNTNELMVDVSGQDLIHTNESFKY